LLKKFLISLKLKVDIGKAVREIAVESLRVLGIKKLLKL